MIEKISSNLETFKSFLFKPGLNIILADKSEDATDKQSRNGSGKSSIVEIIHFLLGASVTGSIFQKDILKNSMFSLDFKIQRNFFHVKRVGDNQNFIDISEGTDQEKNITFKQWCEYLGRLTFNLQEENGSFIPSFRQLFSYFARRRSAGGFEKPQNYFLKQSVGDSQVCLSYLLGLDYTLPKRLQKLRDKEKQIKELRKIQKGVYEEPGTLRTRLTLKENEEKLLKSQLDTFKVVEKYTDLEEEASKLTLEINKLSNENVTDGTCLSILEDSIQEEDFSGIQVIKDLYKEAGLILSDKITKRFEDVVEFNKVITSNHKAHLEGEISRTKERLKKRKLELDKLHNRRSQIMTILQSGGALESFNNLHNDLSCLQEEIVTLRYTLLSLENITSKNSENKIEKQAIFQRLQQDHHEQASKIKQAILIFEEISKALYEKPGSLIIDATDSGPTFNIAIEGNRSLGIHNMQIFCFDMMLIILNQIHNRGPGFLIHDSHLFDGVDERQIKNALQIGKKKSEEYGFQYIITLNSDTLPKNLSSSITDCILSPKLTDKTEEGGIFGLRFD